MSAIAPAFNAVNEDFKPPESWQWNITVSREILKNTVAEVSYIGNHGLHIWRRGVNFNDVPQANRAAVVTAFQNSGDVQALANSLRRFPNLGPITMSESTGDSTYKALQVWVNRRFTDRLSYQFAYTWSHAQSNVPLTSFTSATTDPFNYDLDKGIPTLTAGICLFPTLSTNCLLSKNGGRWQVTFWEIGNLMGSSLSERYTSRRSNRPKWKLFWFGRECSWRLPS